jgi:hypothetical protein
MSGLTVHITNPSDVTAVLYLRDRIDPSALATFPHLTPAVAALTPVALPGAAWEEWIADIANAASGAGMVEPGNPDLARAYEKHRWEIVAWTTRHADDAALASYQPTWIPAMLATGNGEGQLDCEVLPVAGVWWKDVSPRRLLVSQEAYGDHALMDRLLKERILPLLD